MVIKTRYNGRWRVDVSKLKGLYVKVGSWGFEKLVPATPKRILGGAIQRNATGGAVFYTHDERLLASCHVEYDSNDKPWEMSYGDRFLAYRVE